MTDLARGRTLGDRFQLQVSLNELGAGEVWLARDIELRDDVVVKILPREADEAAIELLRRECRNARKLMHPGIVPVYELHRASDRYLVTMAPVEGAPATTLRDRPLPEILEALIAIARALEYAHGRGVVHRDLKTSNVLIDLDGEPRIIDFGISAALTAAGCEPTDGPSVRGGGTEGRSSPQQASGAPASPSDDIYSFGVLARDLTSGQASSDELTALLSSLTARDPRHRPRTMGEVTQMLERIARQDASVPDAKPVRLTPPPRIVRPQPIAPRADRPDGTTPSAAPTAGVRSLERRGGMGPGTVLVFAALLAAAAFVILVLPDWAAEQRTASSVESNIAAEGEMDLSEETTATTLAPSEGSEAEPEDLESLAAVKARATEKEERARAASERLRDRQAGVWGSDDFRRAVDAIDAGSEAMGRRDYVVAESAYDDALAGLEAVESLAPSVYAEAMKRGERALAAGSATEAVDAFTLAGAVRPGDAAAGRGLARARVVDELRLLVAEAERLEQNGSLNEAAERYRRATELDALYRPAQEGLARVDQKASEAAFAAAMSEAVRLLNGEELEAAREAYQRADAIRPGTPDVQSGLAAVESGLRLRSISEHRTQAVGLEAGEAWRKAEAHYQAVLDIDPTIRFAREGKARCATRAALADSLDYHIGNPDRLSEDRVLEEARELLATASAVDRPGARHQGQLQRLNDLVAEFSTPVQVHLLSDGQTEVVVYKVGALGRFDQRELVLRPGTYTVVGRRQGYRDVRYRLVVRAEAPPEPLTVRCEEEI